MYENTYYELTKSAARFLRSVSPETVPEEPTGPRYCLTACPGTVAALREALKHARSRGVRSSLRAGPHPLRPA